MSNSTNYYQNKILLFLDHVSYRGPRSTYISTNISVDMIMLGNSQSTLNRHATNKLIHHLPRVNRWPTDIQVEHPSMSADALTMISAVSYRWHIGQLSVLYESIVELELTNIFYPLLINEHQPQNIISTQSTPV